LCDVAADEKIMFLLAAVNSNQQFLRTTSRKQHVEKSPSHWHLRERGGISPTYWRNRRCVGYGR